MALPEGPIAPALQLVLCALAIYVTYLYYGVVQERITSGGYGEEKEMFTFTLGLLLFQCFCNAALARVLLALSKQGGVPHGHMRSFALCSLCYIGAMFTSNVSLTYVSYPTQVLAKSCKPIPIMVFGVLVNQTRYRWHQYVCVVMVSMGIAVFMFKGSTQTHYAETHAPNSHFGQVLLVLSLVFDGLTGASQDHIKHSMKTTTHQLMLMMNVWSIVFLLVGVLYVGEIPQMMDFCSRHPEVIQDMMAFGAMSALGQNFIFYTIVTYGPLVVSIITTTRKFFTILASVFIFGHALTGMQWVGVFLVLGGLSVDMYYGYSKSPAPIKKSNTMEEGLGEKLLLGTPTMKTKSSG
eukprot:comp23920_c2_seq1/m.42208 comp23920_c2_seq1/g.42208  ORF comp23920_c2_seq1/g.42208 comp23920_c2_seq1/m.42208 type:complete len:351 (-) comp23920_c2_seq1:161-1213(-)